MPQCVAGAFVVVDDSKLSEHLTLTTNRQTQLCISVPKVARPPLHNVTPLNYSLCSQRCHKYKTTTASMHHHRYRCMSLGSIMCFLCCSHVIFFCTNAPHIHFTPNCIHSLCREMDDDKHIRMSSRLWSTFRRSCTDCSCTVTLQRRQMTRGSSFRYAKKTFHQIKDYITVRSKVAQIAGQLVCRT